MNYSIRYVSGPDSEPVTLAEAKTQCRVSGTSDYDADLTRLITAVRQACEREIHRPIGIQTFELGLESFPSDHLEFPWPPLQTVISLKYVDDDGNETVLEDSEASPAVSRGSIYDIEIDEEPGYLFLRPSQSWPSTDLYPGLPVTVKFTAGLDSDDYGEDLKTAILLEVNHLFENRGAIVVGPTSQMAALASAQVPLAFAWMLEKYRYYGEEYSF